MSEPVNQNPTVTVEGWGQTVKFGSERRGIEVGQILDISSSRLMSDWRFKGSNPRARVVSVVPSTRSNIPGVMSITLQQLT